MFKVFSNLIESMIPCDIVLKFKKKKVIHLISMRGNSIKSPEESAL